MANKRTLKKNLGNIMDDLFAASMLSALQQDANREKATEVQERILRVYSDFNSRLSNYERRNARPFFRQFKAEINAEIEDIVKGIEEI